MAVITLRPSGDGTGTATWTRFDAAGTFASKVYDVVASNDGDTTYVQSPNVTTSTLFLDLDDVPADFDPAAVTALAIEVAHRRVNTPVMAVDAGTVHARLVRLDEVTAISTTPTAVSSPIQAGYLQTSFAPTVTGTHTVADWNGARVALTFTHTAASTVDSVNRIRITAVEVDVTYTPVAGAPPELLPRHTHRYGFQSQIRR